MEPLWAAVMGVALSAVFSLVKPQSWPKERKEALATILALVVGLVYGAYQVWVTDQAQGPKEVAEALWANPAIVWATSQGYYRFIAEKLGIEKVERVIRDTAVGLLNPPA